MYSGHWLKSFTFWAGPSRVIDLCEHLHDISSYCLRFPGNIGSKSHGVVLTSLESDVRIQTKRMYHRIKKKEYEVERKREKERKRKRENVCVDQPIVHHIPRF
ncbi:hypothetical protein ACN42_g9988 [Penicillium freii]|uniref:Uncharacterized protein n=1 Tax=Penicillium freii TaxID=48697 RepID=A0A101MAV7_PENFR|nr:hypothetical protein ACN42_g9988 [Penicillium freii]